MKKLRVTVAGQIKLFLNRQEGQMATSYDISIPVLILLHPANFHPCPTKRENNQTQAKLTNLPFLEPALAFIPPLLNN